MITVLSTSNNSAIAFCVVQMVSFLYNTCMPSSLPSIINVRNSAVLLRISKFFVTIQGINNCRKHKVTEKLWSLLLIVFALYGCVGAPTKANKKFSNVQQENFDNMLARNKDKSYHLGNKILEKEFNDSVKLAMGEYMDSVKLFVNWKAQIQNINSRETGKSIALSFELEYAPEQYRKVTFDVDSLVSTKKS